MKRMTLLTITTIASGLISSSCIFDSPQDDEFYRTLWKSDFAPLGPLEVNTLTVEFLCNNYISICTSPDEVKIYGSYSCEGYKAVFQGLTLHLDGYEITFLEAERSGDYLFLTWSINVEVYPFTTTLHRLSDYEN